VSRVCALLSSVYFLPPSLSRFGRHAHADLVILEGLLISVTEGVKLLSVKSHTSMDPSTLPRKSIPGRVGDHRPVVR